MTPIAVVDYARLKDNIRSMADRANKFGVSLRPHVKTHKCVEIGLLQQKHGAKGITVSTIWEAYEFSKHGFSDITLAIPIAEDKMKAALNLSSKISLNLLVDNPVTVKKLNKTARQLGTRARVLLKVDCGLHRCGINPQKPSSIELVRDITEARNLDFKGILTHAGHSYSATTIEQVQEIAQSEQKVMVDFAHLLESADPDMKPEVVSIGSTPTMSLTKHMAPEITEIRPGNYVFYDFTQVAIGSCRLEDCALRVRASIIGVYDDRIVIDAGATALSKDRGPVKQLGESGYGKIMMSERRKDDVGTGSIVAVSQEHGKITWTTGNLSEVLRVGDIVEIIPNHSCLTANLFDRYHIEENGRIIDEWRAFRDRPPLSS